MVYVCWSFYFIYYCNHVSPIQDESFWDCSSMGWGMAKRLPLPKICQTYPTMMKLGTAIPYLKKVLTIYESGDTPLECC